MSDPSDDLPWDVWEKLRILDLELHEGDITQKGYEKKKALLLKPYTNDSLPPVPTHASAVENGSDVNLPMFAATSNDHPRDIQSPSIKSISNATDPETQHSTDDNNAFHSEDLEYNELGEPIDLGPEPSAADVVDFLDYLPSPTHSPTRTNTAASSSSYFDLQLKDQETASRSMSPSMAATQPAGMPLSGSSTNLTMLNQYRPYPSQQPPLPPTLQQPPWPQPMPPTHPVTGLPMRPANRPMYDNRMPPRQPYPGAGPPPPAHGSASLQHFGQPPPQPRYMMPGYAPSNASGIYSPGPMYRPLPSSAGQPYALQNPNTPSISGNSVANYPLPRPNRLPINGTNVDPSLLHHNPGRPVPPPVAVPPDPSIPQDMITSPIRQQAFQNELDWGKFVDLWRMSVRRGRERTSMAQILEGGVGRQA
ncbi:uncharacterized protein BYT42DRAFT_10680 [Radiomyces spectabilis]|uniref:uncharacterized protein n=1 Tax=Radiomyces spectabilis TaxID=64574 RepID=UPI00221FD3C5|nr:uncharacterized protein BYT42DRAFT_10680 [Radiomyces spectabilis]KAI8393542.1 hypothetical protein BYT42DRAFT_10680 [Radiomyces spectabilis]